MKLRLLLPSHILIDEDVRKVVAEGLDGSFCLEPRHVDFVSALRPGLLQYQLHNGTDIFVAVDEGILVKCADEVHVSVNNAIEGGDLATLKDTVKRRFLELDDNERTARSALARLEAGVLRRFTLIKDGL